MQQLAQNSAAEIRRSYNKRLDEALDKIVRSLFPDRFRASAIVLSDSPCNFESRSMVRLGIGTSLSMSSMLRSLQHRSRVSVASLVLLVSVS